MPNNFFLTKLFKVLVIIAVFGLLIFLNPTGISNPVRSVVIGISYPFQNFFNFISYKISMSKDFLFSIGDLKSENEKLIEENQKITAEMAALKDIKKENDILREQINLIPSKKFNLESAEVINQDYFGSGNWITIDKGSSSGISNGMAVIVSGGMLVGKVDEVFPATSKIILITNPQSNINAIISRSETKGIAKGEYGLGVIFDMALQTDSIEIGDEVITSGVGGNMPKGLFIGKVQEIHSTEDKLFQQATVMPSVKFSKLRVVFVIK